MLLVVGSSSAQTSADGVEALVGELSQLEGAEVASVGPVMMKVARAAARKNQDMTDAERSLFNNTKRMTVVELSESPIAAKSAFKSRMEGFDVDGFLKAGSVSGLKAMLFYHTLDGRVDFIVMALFEETNTSLTVFEGDFEEAFARTFLSTNVKKQEQPVN